MQGLTKVKIFQHMLALKDTCIHPTSKELYIKAASGGTDNSPEGLQVILHLSQNTVPSS
jgi:hypothetical protein